MKHRLICRKGFGYVLVAELGGTTYIPDSQMLIFKSPDMDDKMQNKIKQAEELFECKCEYENCVFL